MGCRQCRHRPGGACPLSGRVPWRGSTLELRGSPRTARGQRGDAAPWSSLCFWGIPSAARPPSLLGSLQACSTQFTSPLLTWISRSRTSWWGSSGFEWRCGRQAARRREAWPPTRSGVSTGLSSWRTSADRRPSTAWPSSVRSSTRSWRRWGRVACRWSFLRTRAIAWGRTACR
ncbi:unnamed protein product [Ectocarpus fasciculatus]